MLKCDMSPFEQRVYREREELVEDALEKEQDTAVERGHSLLDTRGEELLHVNM